jgi:hypothetical protein
MGLFTFFKFLKPNKAKSVHLDSKEFVPFLLEDDYCQIEIVPYENKSFIENQCEQTNDLADKSRTEFGFTEIFVRDSMPVKTITKEIRVDYLEYTLTGFGLTKAKRIKYEQNGIIDCQNGKMKAFGFSTFTIFFDFENEFVENIWIHFGGIETTERDELIQSMLYCLGEECELLLVDWNQLVSVDLKNRIQIKRYFKLIGP